MAAQGGTGTIEMAGSFPPVRNIRHRGKDPGKQPLQEGHVSDDPDPLFPAIWKRIILSRQNEFAP